MQGVHGCGPGRPGGTAAARAAGGAQDRPSSLRFLSPHPAATPSQGRHPACPHSLGAVAVSSQRLMGMQPLTGGRLSAEGDPDSDESPPPGTPGGC